MFFSVYIRHIICFFFGVVHVFNSIYLLDLEVGFSILKSSHKNVIIYSTFCHFKPGLLFLLQNTKEDFSKNAGN